jgi:DNA repair protein RadC
MSRRQREPAAKTGAESAEVRNLSNGAALRGNSKCGRSAEKVRNLSISPDLSLSDRQPKAEPGSPADPVAPAPSLVPTQPRKSRERSPGKPPPEHGDGWPEGTPPSLARGLPAPEQAVIDAALAILTRRVQEPGAVLDSPGRVKELLRLHLAQCERERFAVLFLTSQHAVIAFEVLFEGTLMQTSVFPREVAKRALQLNAGAVILAHNHPGGAAEPSRADEFLTRTLSEALRLIDVRVLDHMVIGWPGVVSFAERGMMSEPKPPAWPTPAARPRPVARGRGKAPASAPAAALASGGPA